ncbi:MAG: hypothetical protein AABY53_01870 [Bdellovibrionota bacterium]
MKQNVSFNNHPIDRSVNGPAATLTTASIGFAGGDTNLYAYVDTVGKLANIETNLYNYANNNPMSYVDPEGTTPFLIIGAVLAGVFYSTDLETEGAATDELIGVPLAVAGGAGLCKSVQGFRKYKNTSGFGIKYSDNFRVDFHPLKRGGKSLPHYHRRPGIKKHRPWEGGF